MDKNKLGELFGVVIHSPVTRSEVRSLVKAKQDFVNKKATDEDLTYHQASLDAGDIVESFINSLGEDDGKAFVNYYSDEVVAIGNSTQSIDEVANKSEAEVYHLQAQFIFNELSANLKVYGSNSALTGANPADVNLAIEYIDRSLEIEPNNPTFLNLKGLLIWNGLGDKARAKPLIEKAAELAPRDITIQHNLKSLQDPNGCFIATAAFGTPVAYEVNELRLFRDKWLVYNKVGRLFIKIYYKVSPRIANFIQDKPFLKKVIRVGLKPLIQWVDKFNKTKNY
ncbi:tetratricopeptide repeat protein [Acinetobacter rudis]|uniref:CFI-box-CTERM domain-containing protein n=1 Tax=Acinetobacter rudis TaxID=632955 RepID=A0AAW8J9Z7_9GAMM|nr:CFI-box-CTERM domain-containing protein [Acinetobacter rudis]MDQ8936649.1 CFI-box-CTERM domain-containing protein [Acinetobacter rudis]MDQ9018865.1 CFI-box-CTERM domain-containing protein [Acinetobacter rudis]